MFRNLPADVSFVFTEEPEPGCPVASPSSSSSPTVADVHRWLPLLWAAPDLLTTSMSFATPETAAGVAVYGYVDDDLTISTELPDVGAQESDATADGCYYPDGAFFYVETADGQE